LACGPLTTNFDLGILQLSNHQKKIRQETHSDDVTGDGDTPFEIPDGEAPFVAIAVDVFWPASISVGDDGSFSRASFARLNAEVEI